MLYREAFGYALRTARLAQGMTVRDVATSAPMSYSFLSEVERGQKEMSSEFVSYASQAIGVPASKLVLHASEVLADWEAQEAELISAELSQLTK